MKGTCVWIQELEQVNLIILVSLLKNDVKYLEILQRTKLKIPVGQNWKQEKTFFDR